MNRRGHLGTLLLVFAALILVVYALFVMISFGGDLSKSKAELRALSDKGDAVHKTVIKNFEKMISESIEKSKDSINFENDFNESLKNLAEQKRDPNLNHNLYAKISIGNYTLNFDNSKSGYDLIVEDIFENTNVANNDLRYIYSLKVFFDKTGDISVKVF